MAIFEPYALEAASIFASSDVASETPVSIGFQGSDQLIASNSTRNSEVTTVSRIEKTKAVRIT